MKSYYEVIIIVIMMDRREKGKHADIIISEISLNTNYVE